MIRYIDKYRKIILYLIFGFLTTLINILSYMFLKNILNIDYMISNIIAWCLSIAFAYTTNKLYVFSSDKNSKYNVIKEMFLFAMTRISTLAVDVIIMYFGISILNFNDTAVKIISNIIVVIVNYILSKYIVFKVKN